MKKICTYDIDCKNYKGCKGICSFDCEQYERDINAIVTNEDIFNKGIFIGWVALSKNCKKGYEYTEEYIEPDMTTLVVGKRCKVNCKDCCVEFCPDINK